MATTSSLILLSLFGVASGQLYVQRFDGIYEGTTQILTKSFGVGSMCYNGKDIYYTSAAQIGTGTETGTVYTFQPGSTTTAVHANITTDILDNVDCCCNIVAYGFYSANDKAYRVEVDFLGRNVQWHLQIANDTAFDAIVVIDCNTGRLYVVGQYTVWCFDLKNPVAPVNTINLIPPLPAAPRCGDVFNDTNGDTHIFATFDGTQEMAIIDKASGSTCNITFEESGSTLNMLCVTIDGALLHGFARNPVPQGTSFFAQEYDFMYDANSLLSKSSPVSLNSASTGTHYTSYFLATNVNGISSCTNCMDACMDINCTSCADPCGYCSPDTGECVCENSAIDQCAYNDITIHDSCLGPQMVPDACCIVKYPLAQRREGPDITVLGCTAQTQPGVIDIGRLVQTGRWPVTALPDPRTEMTPSYCRGFSAPVPAVGKGRRFGVYFATFTPDDPLYRDETLPCIATENSGFYNKYYTYTKSLGDSVTLQAKFNVRNMNFKSMLEWQYRRTDVFDPPAVPIPHCDTWLNCTKDNLTVGDEGVYEVYRTPRYKRTWHPLFYLFVRTCEANMCGDACSKPCPACEQGVCDESSCSCICYAGWTGQLCNKTCDAGYIGQQCNLRCRDLFPSCPLCEELLICRPGKAGCSCSTGLEPPECKEPCATGTWGPNCRNNCTATPCDARTGL